MGFDKIHFTKDTEGKIRWKYVDGEGETLAQSTKGYNTLEEARDSSQTVTGIRVEFDADFRNVLGCTLWRPNAVGANASEVVPPAEEPPVSEGVA